MKTARIPFFGDTTLCQWVVGFWHFKERTVTFRMEYPREIQHAYGHCNMVLKLFSGTDRHSHGKFCNGFLAGRLMQFCFHRPWKCHLGSIGFKMKPCIHLRSDEGSWFYGSVVQIKTYWFGISAICTCSNTNIYNTARWSKFMMAQKLWVIW